MPANSLPLRFVGGPADFPPYLTGFVKVATTLVYQEDLVFLDRYNRRQYQFRS